MLRTMTFLTVFLVISGCWDTREAITVPDTEVNFCEVVQGEKLFQPETASAIVSTDRAVAEQIETENEVWRDECRVSVE